MYYERLLRIFKDSLVISPEYPFSLVAQLDDFLDKNYSPYKKNLSPYQFANFANIKFSTALKFFMIFAQDDGVFEMIYYFDCSSECSSRVYLTREDLNDMDNVVFCEECNKSYKISDIIRYVKVNFRLKQFKEEQQQILDENCVFDVLKGSESHLKDQSPSSLDSQGSQDEGDAPQNIHEEVALEEVVTNNVIEDEPILTFLSSMTSFMHR
ncbi:hypothetical protein [Paenibacillus graminis]|uniref:hypothetical protein n=1 Tax=Paenibacillus graminis TaxID=189425 RepID=UPI002DB83507|nr:hypothetical protein [Paenibacillus graminis]MEC0168640.1 hypothetical protein [Paenibacillus graminis]